MTLKEVIKIRNISQTDLAQKMGKCQAAVSQWVRGKTSPAIKECPQLAEILGVGLDDIISCFSQSPQSSLVEEKELKTTIPQIDLEELYEAAQPLIDLLKKKGNPHMTALVSESEIKIVADIVGIPLIV